MKKNFYITTTLPYVNAPLHLGHAVEIIRADAIARVKKLEGYNVFFNTGTDEHGAKIFESAKKAGKEVKEYVDFYADLYKKTLREFGVLSEGEGIHFVRTTDENHVASAEEFWKRCDKNGYIYKKEYEAKYCVGCEEEKTESELVDGKCPDHNLVPEIIKEENYFFKLSAFGEKLLAFYEENPDFVVPAYRLNELKEFIKSGLRDFSISRLKEKMSWGVPVPGDDEHVMYVWFDALVNYISTLGWPNEEGNFKDFWVEGTPTQYCGKNNTRFQGLMWQAMLMGAGVGPTEKIVVDGFILGEGGVKMSKTLGNTIDPLDIVKEYGTDALRYFVLREFHPFEDTAVSKEKLLESYNANLANGIGNLTSRIMKMAETNLENPVSITEEELSKEYFEITEDFDFGKLTDYVWREIQEIDKHIQETEPFKLVKTEKEKALSIMEGLVKNLYKVALMLEPLLPDTSKKIKACIEKNAVPSEPLFLRK
jgi:methionyl-tRNA synthetase